MNNDQSVNQMNNSSQPSMGGAKEGVKKTPRDFFLYLFATVAIYFASINLILLLWQYVDYFFPQPGAILYRTGISGAMRFAVASLVIVFPAYVLVMRFLGRDLDRHPEKREMRTRKWLIFLTLFIAALTIIGDLVSLVYIFLGGDFTIRFVLKALSVLIVAAGVFSYYLFNLRREPGTKEGKRKGIIWTSSLAVAAIIIGAFFIVGSPTTNRQKNFDLRRVSDLQTIQWQVVNYWQAKQKLPTALADLQDPIGGFITPTDPDNGASYEYQVLGDKKFELCGTFAFPSEQGITTPIMTKPMPVSPASPAGVRGEPISDNWSHDTGRVCFIRTIDPDLYPPRLKQ